jgi:hypothetical protein
MRTGTRKLWYFICSALAMVAIASFSSFAYMSTIPKGRFINKVFSNVTKTGGVKYGSNTNPLNNNVATNLLCDIFEPTGDTCTSRPCLVCVFGGGFVSGNRTGPGGDGDASTFANYGYVTAAIDYRIWGNPNDAAYKIWPAGFVVSAQDARACIRYMRAHASTYRIDTSRIAIVGCSSGAFTTLNVAFMDKPSKIPSVVDTTIYGGIEGNSGTPGVSSKVVAAAGNSGAFLDTNWIEAGSPPYAGYQSTPDGVGVPTDVGTMWTYWTFYGITPISARLTHMGLLAGTLVGNPGAHCPGNFPDSAHMFLYNAMCAVGRKSGANTNLALSKTASQSSTSANLVASRAVDGNTVGTASANSFSQTTSTAQAWWQVDLGSLNIIDSIWTYNRTDSDVERQTNYDVKFGLDGTNWETCAYERSIMGTPGKYKFRGGILGRYVRIQLRGTNSLNLAEVQVWGRDTANITGALDRGIPSGSPARTAASPSSFLVRIGAGAVAIPQQLRESDRDAAVYNLMGKLLGKGVIKAGRLHMDASRSVKPGIYFVKVSSQK